MGVIRPDEELIKKTLARKEDAIKIANLKFSEFMHDLDVILQKHNFTINGACSDPEYIITVDGFSFTFYKD